MDIFHIKGAVKIKYINANKKVVYRAKIKWISVVSEKTQKENQNTQIMNTQKNTGIKISFDFDGTLEFPEVQNFAKEMIHKGHDVHIVTTRWDDEHRKDMKIEPNTKVWKVAEEVGIPRSKVHFTNMEWKADFLNEKGFHVHLDDNSHELRLLRETNCQGVFVNEHNWQKNFRDMIDGIKYSYNE